MIETITINGTPYSPDQITYNQVASKTQFEESVLSFCRAWLLGNEQFSLTTSGSTSKPKAISLSREKMIASAKKTEAVLGLKQGWTSLICLDTRFIAGQMMLVRSFVSGMNIYAVEPTRNPLKRVPSSIKFNFTGLVPYQLQSIIETEPQRLNDFDAVIIGGAGVDISLRNKVQHFKSRIYSTYGMTETVSHIALQKLNGHNAQHHFHTLPGTTVTEESRGCLVANVDFLDEEIVTNDLVKCHSSSEFSWLGRWDNVINSGGIKIIPEKVEQSLQVKFDEAAIKNNFFIAGIPHDKLGYQVTLIVEGNRSVALVNSLQKIMTSTLSKYEIPKSIHFVKDFCQTKSGKVSRIETLKLILV